jgi:hypothetical protein
VLLTGCRIQIRYYWFGVVVGLLNSSAPAKSRLRTNTAHTASTLSFKARSTAECLLVEKYKASTEQEASEAGCMPTLRIAHKAMRRSWRQPIDRTAQKNLGWRKFGSAKPLRCGNFDGNLRQIRIDF